MAVRLVAVALSCWTVANLPAAANAQEPPPESPPEALAATGSGVLPALGREARLYLADSKAILVAPFHWSQTDIEKALGAAAIVGGVMVFDKRLAAESQERRSGFTNSLSKTTTPFGAYAAYGVSSVLIVGGLAFKDSPVTTMGREALEAALLSDLVSSVLKPVFGRERPYVSDNETSFKPFTKNYSFPSGHATVAFATASVIAARSSGWLVPTVAYTVATLVAFDRVNDRQHFPSDVIAGGIIGITIGRFIVHRHQKAEAAQAPKAEFTLFPIRNGLGFAARF